MYLAAENYAGISHLIRSVSTMLEAGTLLQ